MERRRRVVIAPIEWDVVDLAESCNLEIAGFFDRDGNRPTADLPLLGTDEDWPAFHEKNSDVNVIIVVDPPRTRERLFDLYGSAVMTVISPTAHVSQRAKVGRGSVIQHGAAVMAMAELGIGCSINVGALIHHEVRAGDFCTIGPGAILAGAVALEPFSYVGAGAVLLQNVRVGRNAKVGAGAVVVRDVAPGEVVMGVPARSRN